MLASMIRKPRPERRTADHLHPLNIVSPITIGLLSAALGVASAAAWSWSGPQWDHLFGAWLGLGFGGGLVWAVRIIAGNALGKEAMGFGDVTLMAMIGAWMGWQPALLVFAIAPFAALAIAAFQLIVIRHTEIAFGPYLSLGAVVVLVNWGTLWHDWAKFGVFALGPILLAIIAVCLVLMAGMLGGWRAIQTRWTGDRE
jgi:prepilin signal peptidase PulO-like enzyme (type II secretory pathway)